VAVKCPPFLGEERITGAKYWLFLVFVAAKGARQVAAIFCERVYQRCKWHNVVDVKLV